MNIQWMCIGLIVMSLLVGCGGGLDPKTVTVKYWDTVKADDKEAMKAYVTKASITKIELTKNKKKKFDPETMSVTIGEATLQSDPNKANVSTTMTMKAEGKEMTYDTVLVKEEGAWKIDLDLTTRSMMEKGYGMATQKISEGMSGKMQIDPKTGKMVVYPTSEDTKNLTEDLLNINKEEQEKQMEEMKKKGEEMRKEMEKKFKKKEDK